MAAKANKKNTELTCFLCSYPLTSTKSALTEEVLSLIAEPKALRRPNQHDLSEQSRIAAIDKDQVVATKCGHMYHMGCLRTFIKVGIEKKGTAFCPICTKPVTLARVWPVLIPPTDNQVARFENLAATREQNVRLKEELQMMRQRIQDRNLKLKKTQQQISDCIEDIREKQSSLEQLAVPSEADLDELRKIHSKRQMIVKVVTKHNADLLELLMRETNVQVSEAEIASENPPFRRRSDKRKPKKVKDHRRLYSIDEPRESPEEEPQMTLPSDSAATFHHLSRTTFSTKSFDQVNNNVSGNLHNSTHPSGEDPQPPMDFIVRPVRPTFMDPNHLRPNPGKPKGKLSNRKNTNAATILPRQEAGEKFRSKVTDNVRKQVIQRPDWKN